MKDLKRHFSKATGLGNTTSYLDKEYNDFRKVSHDEIWREQQDEKSKAKFLKVPVNIADSLKRNSEKKAWKEFKLYVKYLDMKVQNPDCGTFQIFDSHRYYQRTIKRLIQKGWATRKGKKIFLKAYQHVWRDLGITKVNDNGILRFRYWKIPVNIFSEQRKTYLKEIEHQIRQRISKRKLAQIRYALKEQDNRATFSSMSAGSLFGYKSTYSGSKLREKYFKVLPMTPEQSKPKWNKKNGRYEEPTKQIEI